MSIKLLGSKILNSVSNLNLLYFTLKAYEMVVAGGLIIGIINYGMTVLMIDASMQKVVMGALIIIAVTLDHFVSKSSSK